MQVVGMISSALFGLGSIILFLVFAQNRQSVQAAAGLLFGAAGLLLTAFFLLPWIQVPSELKTFGTIFDLLIAQAPPDLKAELDSNGLMIELNRLLKDGIFLTGWNFANDLPTTSSESQLIFFMLPSLALVALVAAGIILSNQGAAKMLGLFLIVVSSLNLILLFFSLRAIRTFGLDAGLFAPVLDLLGIRLGLGVWMSMLGLVYVIVAGVFVIQLQPTKATRKGFVRRSKPRLGRSR